MKLRPKSLLLVILGILLTARMAVAGTPRIGSTTKPLQFTSGGHIVGFTSKDVLVATGSHALRMEFVGAQGVEPVAAGTATPDGKATPLTRVTYPGLWEGINLAYDAPTGLLRSTYTIAPGADPKLIRLRYNVPVAVEPGGELKIAFAAGAMHESAPIAWQEIDGRRLDVAVAFAMKSETEVGFQLGRYDKDRPLTIDPTLTWNTFLGGSGGDSGNGVAIDQVGNSYVTGESAASWGSPIRAFSGSGSKAFVAKLNNSGALVWNTFLGGSFGDGAYAIAIDANSNSYVTGYSNVSWGNPIRSHSSSNDAVVVKLDADGNLVWNTFLGGTEGDAGHGIAVDAAGNCYVTGNSAAAWGNPIRAFIGSYADGFVAKLNSSGALVWNTFLGGVGTEYVFSLVVDANGNLYVAGQSPESWGNPIRASAGNDAFVAKLNANGVLVWNTFLGGSDSDFGRGIAIDAWNNLYLTGFSSSTWGSPISPHSASQDAFVVKLNGSGVIEWNTFLGGNGLEQAMGIAVGLNGDAYIVGSSDASWGNPIRAYAGGTDVFVARLSSNGSIIWNSFLGGTAADFGYGISHNENGNTAITGISRATWANPIRGYSEGYDVFVTVVADPTWRTGEVDKGGGWKQLSWFGIYNSSFEPWIYHAQHGWLYPYDNGGGAVFFWYDAMQQFVWINSSMYPFMYRYDATPSWLWYVKGSASPRKFYDYGAGAWENLP